MILLPAKRRESFDVARRRAGRKNVDDASRRRRASPADRSLPLTLLDVLDVELRA